MQFRWALPLAVAACSAAPEAPGPSVPAQLVLVSRLVIDLPGVSGLSDLAVDEAGRVWSVAERVRTAVRIDRPGAAPVAVPLVGIPDRVDVEGLAWIDRDRVAMATEADVGMRTSDAVLLARLGPGGLEVYERRDLDYAIWPLDPIGNQGIEGLCRAGSSLVLAVETVVADASARFAPIAVHDLSTGRWTPFLLRLTTRTGKISALSCHARRGSIDVLAVERHFEVARLIRFSIRQGAPPRRPPLEPVVVADLAPVMAHQENFEGLIWDGARAVWLVVDNDWTHVTGPNLLVRARLDGRLPAAD